MLIGGFQHIDIEKAMLEQSGSTMPLRFDTQGRYKRQALTNNGRTATVHVLRNCMKLGREDVILLPDYMCLSIIAAIEEAGVSYRCYRIRRDLSIDMEDLESKLDDHVKCVYITHFFGVPHEKTTVERLRGLGRPIVEDVTQTLLTRDGDGRMGFGDYIVASTRKWYPNTDGGLAAAREDLPFEEEGLAQPYNEAAYKQLLISLMREYFQAHPEADRRDYLKLEKEANRVRYTDLAVRSITPYSKNIMLGQDNEAIVLKRRRNYRYLYDRLGSMSGITIGSKPMDYNGDQCPFGMFLLIEGGDRDRFHDYLVSCGVIGEIQWILPQGYYEPGEDAKYLNDHNLMISCDQRYDERQMQIQADVIQTYLNSTNRC